MSMLLIGMCIGAGGALVLALGWLAFRAWIWRVTAD